ncbi:MAG: hypothetical protein ACQEQF_13015 [Bacillota bacterium]
MKWIIYKHILQGIKATKYSQEKLEKLKHKTTIKVLNIAKSSEKNN